MIRTVILTGAPETKRLDWSENSLFSASYTEQDSVLQNPETTPNSATAFSARWRQLPTESVQMRPVLSKLNLEAHKIDEIDTSQANFFSHTDLISQTPLSNRDSSNDSYASTKDSEESASEALSEFYDHSFTIHEAVPSSQLTEIFEMTPGTPTYESDEVSLTPQVPGLTGGIIRVPSQRRLSQLPRPKHLSDLEDIPNASYLRSVEPSTVTVNLIVAISSISEPKTVVAGARYGKPRETELVEMLVGDDTKSGFSITMWLPREMHVNWKDGAHFTPEGQRSALRRDLKMLRSRDIVLLQNVALSSFKGKVHGQSLRRDVTKINLLFRKKIDDQDVAGVYGVQSLRNATDSDQQLLKVKKVRDWLLEFVGERKGVTGRRGGRRDVLPPDTQ